jgi:endonuclease/exonuclease/phosphatase family metal-dependent hydrolase
MRVRVVVYNVRGLRDGRKNVAAVLERLSPDLVLLNESDGRWALRRLAGELGLRVAADPWSPIRRRVKDAVLVRPPWRILERGFVRFPGSARFHPRGAVLALVEREGRRTWAVATHLGLHPLERLHHARELAERLAGLDDPVLLGGDLNDRPDGRAASFLAERLGDAWLLGGDADGDTFPADEPSARIDYLFVSPGVRVERAMVPPIPLVRVASDHRPVVAEVTLPEGG